MHSFRIRPLGSHSCFYVEGGAKGATHKYGNPFLCFDRSLSFLCILVGSSPGWSTNVVYITEYDVIYILVLVTKGFGPHLLHYFLFLINLNSSILIYFPCLIEVSNLLHNRF